MSGDGFPHPNPSPGGRGANYHPSPSGRGAEGEGRSRETKSTCPYCGVGCGVIIESHNNEITNVRGDPDHPANFGRLCTKGSTLHLTARPVIYAQTRALFPELKTDRSNPRTRTDWNTALDFVANKIAQTVQQYGPDSIGIYISGQLLTEDYYVFNKLAKGLLGTNNVDTNSRLCMSSAVAGYKQALGADSVPNCYEDIDHADLIFIAGSNTAFAHPIVYRRIEDARKKNPALKLVVVDPRKTDTARDADLHLQILPGTDVALFHGMLHLLLWERLVDENYIAAHTEGFAELKALVRDYTPKMVSEVCGIKEAELIEAALLFGRAKAALSMYCQGLNQSSSGTAKNAALINLHLATGQIGRPGAGPFSLTGQPNAMGGREVGGLANLLSAHRDLSNAEHRAEVARLWGVNDVPAKPGKTAVEMFEAAARGEIKVLWIACTNPAQSMPNQAVVRAALEKAELVVLQEAYATTATAAYADVLLPATTWGEKEGTVTNSERRISRVRRAVKPAGEARDDWQIATDIAHRIEQHLRPGQTTLFPYDNPESVWNEHRETTRGRDLDITGLSYTILEARGPQLWPFPEGAREGQQRLYTDGIYPTASGKAKFFTAPYKPVAEQVDARFPFRLTTGRLRDQWHAMSRTGTLGRLFGHAPEPSVQLNSHDIARRGLSAGDLVHVTSRRGSLVLPLAASDDVRLGEAFIAMHWGSEFVAGRGNDNEAPHSYGVNTVTHDAFDPISKQPELKHAAVKILKAELPWRCVAFARVPVAQQLGTVQRLRALLPQFAYASVVPFGHDDASSGVLLRAAASEAPADALRELEQLLQLNEPGVLRYDDARRGQHRRVRVQDDRVLAVVLCGDVKALAAENWLRDFVEQGQAASIVGRALLFAGAQPPVAMPARGKIVCNCFNVAQGDIDACLAQLDAQTEPLTALQNKLQCGTNCGSCVPELRRLIAARGSTVAVT